MSYVNLIRNGAFVLGLSVLSLSACSSGNFTNSAFSNSKVSVAEVPNLGSYTADTALYEARNHFRNDDFGYSAAFYKRVVELTPRNPEGYVGLGASYDRLRRFDLADRVYAKLLKVSGASVQYYNNVGYSYMLRGDLKAALINFRKAQSLAPDNEVVANNIRILANAAGASNA